MRDRYNRIAILALLAVAATGQSLDPSEARLTAGPYFPKPAVTIQAKSELVEIGVVARDSRGRSVGGLTKSNFEVRDEGKRREISTFTVQSFEKAVATAAAPTSATPTPAPAGPPPRWVAMVFDDLNTPPGDLYYAKAAAKRFLQAGLAANDRVGVLTIARGVVLSFSTDAVKIAEAVDQVDYRGHKRSTGNCPVLTPYDAYVIANKLDATALDSKAQEYGICSNSCPQASAGGGRGGRGGGAAATTGCVDESLREQVRMMSSAIWEELELQSRNTLHTLEAIVNSMAMRQGGRVILLASSGFLAGKLEFDQDQLVDRALRANVVINSLDAKGLFTTEEHISATGVGGAAKIRQQQLGSRPKSALNDAMANLAESTGGSFFHNNNDLERGFKELDEQPEVSYLLGIAPEKLDGKYHRLKVSLTGARNVTAQARKGYMAIGENPKAQDTPTDTRLDREVFTTTTLQDAPVTVSAASEKAADGRQLARLTLHVDIGKAQFRVQNGERAQKFRMLAVFSDAQGAFVKGLGSMLEFALKEASYQRLQESGFDADVRIALPAGSYRMRTVVVEGNDNGRYSTATQPVEIQ